MKSGINNHIQRISSELFIKYGSAERIRINESVSDISKNLKGHFGNKIEDVTIFGSYSRDTILPRRYDPRSDIDILVQYDIENELLNPESYRNQLKTFAQKYYTKSIIRKSHPSIVIELNHISFDLVPAIFDKGFFFDTLEIPSDKLEWMETNPKDFNQELTSANSKYNSIVKPIIRLLKYWNCTQDYPYNSFDLETMIAGMDFKNDNYESGFLYAVKNLSARDLSLKSASKVDALYNNCDWIKEYLERENIHKAKERLAKILPGF